MTALLDAAALADRIADDAAFHDLFGDADAEALRLLASHARDVGAQVAELDAWKRLAIAREHQMSFKNANAYEEAGNAYATLRALGIDPNTSERIATEEPAQVRCAKPYGDVAPVNTFLTPGGVEPSKWRGPKEPR